MADKKFSEFPLVVGPTLADITVVGLDALGQNAQFSGDEFSGGVSAHPALSDRDLADQHPIAAITNLQTELDGKEPALGNPASNGYVLASTTGGTRSWVAQSGGGSALTIEAEGVPLTTAATLINFEGAGVSVTEPIADEITVTIPGSVPYGFIDAGDYILIVAIGDSYIEGFSAPEIGIAPAPNANLYCWMMPTLTSSYVPADIEWVNSVNWDAAARTLQHNDAYAQLKTFTGQYLGAACSPAAMYADAVQRATGKTVFLYQNAMGSMQTTVWLAPAGAGIDGYDSVWGAGNDGLAAAITAMNTITGGSKTAADSMFCSLGTNDNFLGNIDGQTWCDDRWAVFYDQLVDSGWLVPGHTQYVHMETSTNPGVVSTRYSDGWTGFALMLARSTEYVTLLASAGAEPDSPTGIHYTAAAQIIFGNTACIRHLNGPSAASAARQNTYVQTLAPVLGGNVTVTDAVTFTSDMTPTGGTDTVYTFDTANAFSGADRLLDINNNGNTVARFAGEGGFQLFDTSGTQQFAVGAFGLTIFNQPIQHGTGVTTISSAKVNGANVYAFDYNTAALSNASAYLARWQNNSSDRITFKHDGTIATVAGINIGTDLIVTGAAVVGGATTIVGTVGLATGAVSSSVAASGSAFAYSFDTANAMGGGDSIARWRNNGTTLWALRYDGLVTSPGRLTSTVGGGGSDISFIFDTPALVAGDKIASFRNNGTDKLYVGYDGAIEAKAGTPGTTGTLILRPDSSLGTEQLDITSLVHGLTMKWTPSTGASTWTFTNMGADNSGTDFVFRSNTQQTAGNLMVLQNSSAGDLVKFNYLGAPGFWGATPVSARVTGGTNTNTPSTAGSGAITINSTSLWNGGSGTGYSIGDAIKALKDAGLLAA